jgi:hypothetical protein
MRASIVILAAVSVTAAACTTNDMHQAPVEQALTQPFKDLSLLREETPDALKAAAAAPYRSTAECEAIAKEIADLNVLLGKDFDEEVVFKPKVGEEIASNLIGSAVDLPFRGVIRRVSGAAKREREKADAVVASVARRGYLRGLQDERCAEATETPAVAVSATVADPQP